MSMFKIPVSMRVTEQQYSELCSELKKLGYEIVKKHPVDFTAFYDVIINYYSQLGSVGISDLAGTLHLNKYNPKLYLALAAMTKGNNFIKGEYFKCDSEIITSFTKNKLYKVLNFDGSFYECLNDDNEPDGLKPEYITKPTKEEIITYFNQNPFKEENDCISFPAFEDCNIGDIIVFKTGDKQEIIYKDNNFISILNSNSYRTTISKTKYEEFMQNNSIDYIRYVFPKDNWKIQVKEIDQESLTTFRQSLGFPCNNNLDKNDYLYSSGVILRSKTDSYKVITKEEFYHHILNKQQKTENYADRRKETTEVHRSDLSIRSRSCRGRKVFTSTESQIPNRGGYSRNKKRPCFRSTRTF